MRLKWEFTLPKWHYPLSKTYKRIIGYAKTEFARKWTSPQITTRPITFVRRWPTTALSIISVIISFFHIKIVNFKNKLGVICRRGECFMILVSGWASLMEQPLCPSHRLLFPTSLMIRPVSLLKFQSYVMSHSTSDILCNIQKMYNLYTKKRGTSNGYVCCSQRFLMQMK